MRVGIVCEGRTDFFLLEQVVLAAFGPGDVVPLRPMRDALDDTRWTTAGWTQVRQWCEARGMIGIEDERTIGAYDAIVVQVDGDLCGRDGLPLDRPSLCQTIRHGWMGGTPPGVVVCIPAQATDTWLAAALDPAIAASIEADNDPLAHLVRLGVLDPARPGEAAPRKNQYEYRARASALGKHAPTLRPHLSELDRFMTKLEALTP
jgi:hypothetical protein